MKNKLAAILFASLALILGACMTTEPRSSVDRTAAILESTAFIGTAEVLQINADYDHLFLEVVDELLALERRDYIDYDALISVLRRLPINELRGDRAILYVEASRVALQEYGNPAVDLDNEVGENIRVFAIAIRRGIERGLEW